MGLTTEQAQQIAALLAEADARCEKLHPMMRGVGNPEHDDWRTIRAAITDAKAIAAQG